MVYKGKPLWFIKMDDLGVPLFLETPIYIYTYTLFILSENFRMFYDYLLSDEKPERMYKYSDIWFKYKGYTHLKMI